MLRLGPTILGLIFLLSCSQTSPFTDTDVPDVSHYSDTNDSASDSGSPSPDTTVVPDIPDAPRGLDAMPPADGVSTGGAFVIATWNLHNFSKYGVDEWRLEDIAAYITELDADVLAVQELKVKEGTTGSGTQAFDRLLELLPAYDGLHAKWDIKDTTVGLLYKTSTVTLDGHKELFTSDWDAFPRQPLEATITVGGQWTLNVIVLHLKAFKDGLERRRKACKALADYIPKQKNKKYLIIGDLNDDPYDSAASNSYEGTFLNAEPEYHFLSKTLPKGTVTSTGYYTWINGKKHNGEFLDHAIATGALKSAYSTITTEVRGLPESQWADWKKSYSDHFPVLVHFTP